MAKQIKPHHWWAVTYAGPSNDVMPDTIRRTRKEAQKACCDQRYKFRDNWREEWGQWHKRGCRAVRVIVTVTVEATP